MRVRGVGGRFRKQLPEPTVEEAERSIDRKEMRNDLAAAALRGQLSKKLIPDEVKLAIGTQDDELRFWRKLPPVFS